MKEKKREVTNIKTVRLPRPFLESLGIGVGDVVRFQMEDGKIIVTKYGSMEGTA